VHVLLLLLIIIIISIFVKRHKVVTSETNTMPVQWKVIYVPASMYY